MNKLLILLASALVFLSCSSKKAETTANEDASAKKYLIVYYSQVGATKTVAEEFQKLLGADIETIELAEEFPTDYQESIARVQADREAGKTPAVKPLQHNLRDYDTVFLGYPIWFGTFATPMISLLNDLDLSGVNVVNFCTFGSGGLLASTKDLKDQKPGVNVVASYGVRNARIGAAPQEIQEFLTRNGFLEGEVEALEEFSAQQPVSEEESLIFDKAISNYSMLAGTKATTVGSRSIAQGTEYLFNAKSPDRDGNELNIQVWVTLGNNADAPEFTLVER